MAKKIVSRRSATLKRKSPAKGKARKGQIIDERTSGRDDHRTPAWFIERVVKYRTLGLDPAGSPLKNTPASVAKRVYLLKRGEDGLRLPWRGCGLVFCNPPYGRQVGEWADKAVFEFGFGGIGRESDELIMLVAARVDTRWFKKLWRHASAVLLCNRRFQFIGEEDSAKFPQAVLYFGNRAERFAERFGDLGLVITQNPHTHVSSRRAWLHFPPQKERAA